MCGIQSNKKDRTVSTTEERVRQAATESPTSREVLKKLFPEVFMNEHIKLGTLVVIMGDTYIVGRVEGNKAKLINLNNGNLWASESLPIIYDMNGSYVLLHDIHKQAGLNKVTIVSKGE